MEPKMIKDTLIERNAEYGSMEDNADVYLALLHALASHGANPHTLTAMHLACLNMIFMKIARMVSGNANNIDNVHDIVGYAQLLEDYLIKIANEKETRKTNS